MKSPYSTPAESVADWSDVSTLQQKLTESADRIVAMANDLGSARHVLEYDHDLRKRALSRAMQPALSGGDSAAKAEAEGRASPNYSKELEVLSKQHEAAEQTVAEYDAERIKWETARSLLAMLREQVKM